MALDRGRTPRRARSVPDTQAELPGFGADLRQCPLDILRHPRGAAERFGLFVGLFPMGSDMAITERHGRELNRLHGLPKRGEQGDGRSHITLVEMHRELGQYGLLPQLALEGMIMAINAAGPTGFPIRFDRAERFEDSNTLVLRCDRESEANIARLRQTVSQLLRLAGKAVSQSTTPHMSTHYRALDEIVSHAIESWEWRRAPRLGLILSHVGRTHHQWLHEWSLE